MKRAFTHRLVIMFLLLAALAVSSLGAGPEFSADVVMENGKKPNSTKAMNGRFYVKGDKMRQELEMDDGTAVTIIRLDKKVIWTLIPGTNTYMEVAMDNSTDPMVLQDKAGEMADKKELGTETIEGYLCDKVQYTYKDKKLGVTVCWVARDLGFVIKWEQTQSKSFARMQLKNIKRGKQPDSLFELPSGYTKFGLGSLGSLFGND